MSLDWQDWVWLTLIITIIVGFVGYGVFEHKTWAVIVGGGNAFLFACFVVWVLAAMNTDT